MATAAGRRAGVLPAVLATLLVVLLLVTGPSTGDAAAPRHREIGWLALVPQDWKPQDRLDRRKAQLLQDDDAQAREMMRELRAILDTAPTVAALDGALVRMPGFLVPLEQDAKGITEFLLVPYFGACIHTPPPPANQIVHVVARRPVQGFRPMSPVWVSGRLQVTRRASAMGTSGYRMELAAMEIYQSRQ